MKKEPTIEGTLEWYREKGESNEDIARLVEWIEGLSRNLQKITGAWCNEMEKTRAIQKILNGGSPK